MTCRLTRKKQEASGNSPSRAVGIYFTILIGFMPQNVCAKFKRICFNGVEEDEYINGHTPTDKGRLEQVTLRLLLRLAT